MNMEQNLSVPALERDQNPKASTLALGHGSLFGSLIASLSFAASVLVPSASHANEPQIIFQENGWIAFPKQKDPNKGCVMGHHVKNNVHAIIYVNNNETFQIGLTSADWRLEQGTEWKGAIAFDNDRPIATTVSTSFQNTVVVPSGAGEDSLENRIRTAARVRISFNKETYDVSLKGSSNALDMLWSCAEGGMGASTFSLPIQSGFYATADGNCSDGLGPSVIYTDSKSLNWPSSACRFENVKKAGQSQYRVKQTCGRNLDDIETGEDSYIVESTTRFSFKSGGELTVLNRCDPKTLPQTAGITSPFYPLPTAEEIAEYARSKIDADDAAHLTGTVNSMPNLSAIDCLIAVGGETYADGACQWRADKSGSFTVYSGKYSAAVNVDHVSTVHTGYWNAGKGNYSKPEIVIGYMQQDGACWKSATATICAWKIGERQQSVNKPFPGKGTVRKSTIGRIVVGSTDSAIEVRGGDGGKSYGFLTQSKVGREIFKFCQMDDECRIEGDFNEDREWIDAVSHVEKLGSAQAGEKTTALQSTNAAAVATEDDDSTWQKRMANRQRKKQEEEARRAAEYEVDRKKSSEEMRQLAGQYKSPMERVARGKPITLSSADETAVKQLIGLRLRDETSARYRNLSAAEMPDGTYVVCGFVNGKNQFGAYTGYTPFYSNYRPDAKTFTYFVMANYENIPALCGVNGVVFN